jgi:hypothetical protein
MTLAYFLFRHEPYYTTDQLIQARRDWLTADLIAFNRNAESLGLSDSPWADPDTPEGMKKIEARAEELLQEELQNDRIELKLDSCPDTPELRAKTEARPDFVQWLQEIAALETIKIPLQQQHFPKTIADICDPND